MAGSMIYGASVAVALPGWDLWRAALWLTLSAGGSWLVFGPVLWLITRLRIFVIAHACMVAMVWGEIVLVAGSPLNLAVPGPWMPSLIVAVSNVVMAAVLATQLAVLSVPVWKTLACWFVILDGVGAVFFVVLYRLLLQ